MIESITIFQQILAKMVKEHDLVSEGKMMSSPAIQYKGKVFAFFHENAMTFKLGKGFPIETVGIKDVKHLNPFKNKPPMKAWFVVGEEYKEKWEELANKALELFT